MGLQTRQKLITELLSSVLGQLPEPKKTFPWFTNKHNPESFGNQFPVLENLFQLLKGNPQANQEKRKVLLSCDAYFGKPYNFMFEFDESQHFSSARLLTLEHYPKNIRLNFNIDQWKELCRAYKNKADKYRYAKRTSDFDFEGGRTFQRAYLDSFRDLLPTLYELRPTLRISEFEVADILANDKESSKKIERIIKTKITH